MLQLTAWREFPGPGTGRGRPDRAWGLPELRRGNWGFEGAEAAGVHRQSNEQERDEQKGRLEICRGSPFSGRTISNVCEPTTPGGEKKHGKES